jgi:ubiquinone/menaquinone biosynthesis C-methylase UbiE
MNVKESYTAWSSTYDADRNLTRDLASKILKDTFGKQRVDSILEIGCGTGGNIPFLAGIADHVYGLDFSDGMLEKARKNVHSDNITLTFGDLTNVWPYGKHATDLVVCNLVLEHVENLQHIFSEAFRVLKDEGIFFVCELHPFRQYIGGRATFRLGEEITEIHAFIHHISDFVDAAEQAGFVMEKFNEHWHGEDTGKPPRIAMFLFRKINKSN